MEVVGGVVGKHQSSAWSTPLSFNHDHDNDPSQPFSSKPHLHRSSQPQSQTQPHSHPQSSTPAQIHAQSQTQFPLQQPSQMDVELNTRVQRQQDHQQQQRPDSQTPKQHLIEHHSQILAQTHSQLRSLPHQPQSSNLSSTSFPTTSSLTQSSLSLSRQTTLPNSSLPQSVSFADQLSVRLTHPQQHQTSDHSHVLSGQNPSYALVRSESAPLNIWGDRISSHITDIPADDPFPSRNVTFAPIASSNNDHFATSPVEQPSLIHSRIPNSATFDSFHIPSTSDLPLNQQRPPNPRSSSKAPPTRSQSSTELAATLNASRIPGLTAVPSSSSHLPHSAATAHGIPVNSSKRSNGQSLLHKSVFDMIQDDFPRTPSPMFSSLFPTLPTSSPSSNAPHNSSTARARSGPTDRRARLASTASLDLDLDRLRSTSDLANEITSSTLTAEEVTPPNPSPRPSHRRSVSVNWTGDLNSFSPELSRTSSKTNLATSPSTASFFSNGVKEVPGTQLATSQINPSPGSTLEQLQASSPPRSISPVDQVGRGPIVSSPQPSGSLNRLPHASQASSMPSTHVSSFNGPTVPSDSAIPNTIEDLVNNNLPDYDYLYEQPDSSLPGSSNIQHNAQFSSQPYPGTQSHLGAASGVMNSLPQQVANGSYAGLFPGMGLFPSPFSNNAVGNVANGVAPMYPDSFRENIAAADSLKNMSLQMAAFLTAQQQFYAAHAAQMAALAGSSAFTNSAPIAGGLPASGPAHIGNSSQSIHMRSPWEGRNVEPTNSAHRNVASRPRNSFEQYRSNFGPVNSAKKTSSAPDAGAKVRSHIRGRRNHRGNDEVPLMNSHKGTERVSTSSSITVGTQDGNNSRSPLLEDFRATSLSIGRGINSGEIAIGGGANGSYPSTPSAHVQNGREWQLSEIKNHVLEFATDQHGSRFIQQKLETASDEDKEAILKQVLTDAQRLMTDVFGNYVVQKLLDHGGLRAIKSIAGELEGRMLSLSLHMYGCRVVQKALEVLEAPFRSALVKELDGHVLKCIRDQNGNHVIQKCVELVEASAVQFIVSAVQGQAVQLAGHSYGCRVVQRILEYGVMEQKSPIMMEIMSSIPELIKDQYGNYVIQHVVEHGTVEERGVIMKLVRGQVCQLSQHKFASNVVERCLQFGSLEEREVLIEILISGEGGNASTSPLNQLVRDQFGNYVVQRVLDVAMAEQRERVVTILKAQVSAIKKYSYGKHIIARLEEHHHHHHHHYHHHHHRGHGTGSSNSSRSERGSISDGNNTNVNNANDGGSPAAAGVQGGSGSDYPFYR